MARLSYSQRKKLPTSTFALPGKRAYPEPDEEHARKALQLGAKNASPAELAKIKAFTRKHYPSIKQGS